jgi:hypothetical protein
MEMMKLLKNYKFILLFIYAVFQFFQLLFNLYGKAEDLFLKYNYPSYQQWLIIDTIIWTICFFFPIYIFFPYKIYKTQIKKLRLKFKEPFKTSYIKKGVNYLIYGLFLATILIPLLIPGILYYAYNYNWRYTWNQFNQNQLGILIADFREVSLKNYIPQEKYSLFLAERLREIKLECQTKININIKTTPAYFSTAAEAQQFGNKIGADIIIWGEIDKSEGVLSIKPRFNYSGSIYWGLDSTMFGDLYYNVQYHEDWQLAGRPFDIDTIQLFLKDYLIFPTISKMEQFMVNEDEIINYIACKVENNKVIPPFLNGFLHERIGMFYFDKKDYKNSINNLIKSSKLICSDSNITHDKNRLLASNDYDLFKCYSRLSNLDSSYYYGTRAIKEDSSILRKIDLLGQMYCFGKYDYIMNKLLELWGNNKDSLTGDLILNLSKSASKEPDTIFLQKYNLLFPGRFEKNSGGKDIFDCVSDDEL